ncbi:MAG: hypothetical protein HY901_19775 [Deltaproteobacteria bacterium]|nr:hypothetical protein [Deltaproteobacteria bacterium]
MRRILLISLLAVVACGCTPKLLLNQTFLVSEDLKLTPSGFISLKSTGETFDLSPIRRLEPDAGERVVIGKVRGVFLATGDGFRHIWRLWPAGQDQAYYKPLDYNPGPDGFRAATLEIVGPCAVVHWDRGGIAAVAYVTSDGDVDENKCQDK